MPLLDHFHSPLKTHWHPFHHAWATYIASSLNKLLPGQYVAEPNIHFGIEIDVATLEIATSESPPELVVAAESRWMPPAPTLVIPFRVTTDVIEVIVFASDDADKVVGAIELVSPANKDRPETGEVFIAKCEKYLRSGMGVVVVDIVTNYRFNLHNALLERLYTPQNSYVQADLWAAAYHPVETEDEKNLNIWFEALAVDHPLPTLALGIAQGLYVPVDLEATYAETRLNLKIDERLQWKKARSNPD